MTTEYRARFENALFSATRDTLETMAFAEVVPSSSFLDGTNDTRASVQGGQGSDTAWGLATDTATLPDSDPRAASDQRPCGETEWIWARVDVRSSTVSAVQMVVPRVLAESLTDTMYAGDADLVDEQVLRDTVAELANTLCGRLMLALENSVGPFSLSVPTTGEGVPTAHPSAIRCGAVIDGNLTVWTCIEPCDGGLRG